MGDVVRAELVLASLLGPPGGTLHPVLGTRRSAPASQPARASRRHTTPGQSSTWAVPTTLRETIRLGTVNGLLGGARGETVAKG